MEHLEAQELLRLKNLLQRTSEFIAYFEIAENKMEEWQQEIERLANTQRELSRMHLELLQEALNTPPPKPVTTEEKAAITDMSFADEKKQTPLETYFLTLLETHKEQLNTWNEDILLHLQQYATQAIDRLDRHLAQYDVKQFHRLANESCDEIATLANKVIANSQRAVRSMQWRLLGLSVVTSLITAFVVGLYISDEAPWDMHHQALNERQAGKLLLQAWPKLTRHEQHKIVGETS